MLADTPLVKNPDNPRYMKILLDGKANLEELFAELGAMRLAGTDGPNHPGPHSPELPKVRPINGAQGGGRNSKMLKSTALGKGLLLLPMAHRGAAAEQHSN